MRNSTNKNTNPIFNLAIKEESFRRDYTVDGSDFWNGKKCFKCNLPYQLTVESSSEVKVLLVSHSPEREGNDGLWNKETDQEENSKFVLDYIPLCCEEDLELMAYYFSQDQEKKSS